MMNKRALIISLLITIGIGFLANYLFLPAINLRSNGFIFFSILLGIVFTVSLIVMYFILDNSFMLVKVSGIVICSLTLIWIITLIISSPLFQSKVYANRITVKEKDFATDIPVSSDVKSIALMDTASAQILGDRTMGGLTDLISQYEVSDTYYTIEINGEMWKIAPLRYAGFFKYQKNKKDGIPGYVMVNPVTYEAKFVRLEKGYLYSDSSYFSTDLKRYIRNQFPSAIFEEYSFQIDNEGNVYWVVPSLSKKVVLGAKTRNGVIVINAVDGSSQFYDMNEIPEWVDLVYSGDFISELYNSYGTLQKGFLNSVFSNVGCKQTTDDFGYILRDSDIYIYTGITSTSNDESNIGFIMANTRTGEYFYYACSGAEEYSAMAAAEGVVQDFGYVASFPSLVNIGGEPTYVMVLKDNNGLVKLLAMVNVKNYTIVATGETLSKTLSAYSKALRSSGKGVDIDTTNYLEKTFVIADIQFIASAGETTAYIKDTEGKVYKQDFTANENLILLNVGDSITILYEVESSIIQIMEIK